MAGQALNLAVAWTMLLCHDSQSYVRWHWTLIIGTLSVSRVRARRGLRGR